MLLEKKKKRRVIFTHTQLMIVFNGTIGSQVWLLLFSDLLLITRKDGKIFTVQEEPIPLDDLQISDPRGPSMRIITAC